VTVAHQPQNPHVFTMAGVVDAALDGDQAVEIDPVGSRSAIRPFDPAIPRLGVFVGASAVGDYSLSTQPASFFQGRQANPHFFQYFSSSGQDSAHPPELTRKSRR
jgi:hypothetical protein